MFLTYKLANKPSGILAAFAFTGFLGYILGPMLTLTCPQAWAISSAWRWAAPPWFFFCCSAYVLTTRKDMSFDGCM